MSMLYLHETIDIVGDGQDAYLETVARRATHSEKEGISRLVGCWRVVGSTNRWPRVVNLWEMDSWAHWGRTLERQFLPERRDPSLAPWWAQAAQWRSGGFDRILEPVPRCPTRAELVAAGISAWVCEQTILRARPGAADELLNSAMANVAPALNRRAIRLFGAYTVPMRSDELLLLWAAPTFADLCGWYDDRRGETAWGRWQSSVATHALAADTCWLVPGASNFFHPSQAAAGG
jgi:hypothetical protein